MKNLQETFNQTQELKKEQKTLKALIKEAYDKSEDYKSVIESLKSLKYKKSQIEAQITQEYRKELDRIDSLKVEIQSNQSLLSDMAFTSYVNGDPVEVTDKYNQVYEPQFKVNFKKSNVVKAPEVGIF